jgi:hypothetical protein
LIGRVYRWVDFALGGWSDDVKEFVMAHPHLSVLAGLSALLIFYGIIKVIGSSIQTIYQYNHAALPLPANHSTTFYGAKMRSLERAEKASEKYD